MLHDLLEVEVVFLSFFLFLFFKKREITTAVQKVQESFIADLTVAMKDQLDYKPTRRGSGITIRKSSQTSKAILSVARIQGYAIHFCGFQGEN